MSRILSPLLFSFGSLLYVLVFVILRSRSLAFALKLPPFRKRAPVGTMSILPKVSLLCWRWVRKSEGCKESHRRSHRYIHEISQVPELAENATLSLPLFILSFYLFCLCLIWRTQQFTVRMNRSYHKHRTRVKEKGRITQRHKLRTRRGPFGRRTNLGVTAPKK